MGCSESCSSGQELPALAFLGLCDAGKSTIIGYIQHKTFRLTHPTLGAEMNSVVYRDMRFEVWDVSGRDCSYWSRYYQFAVAIVFVVDGQNKEDLDLFVEYAKLALANLNVQKNPILVYINKVNEEEGTAVCNTLKEKLDISHKNLNINFQICDPKTGKGVMDGFDWIMGCITKT